MARTNQEPKTSVLILHRPRAPAQHRLLPLAAALIAGVLVALLVAFLVAPAAEIMMRANRAAHDLIGWTWYGFLTLSLWTVLGVVVRDAAPGTANRWAHLADVEVLAPALGIMGTMSGLIQALAISKPDNLLQLTPYIGHAFVSTLVGVGMSSVAYIMARLAPWIERVCWPWARTAVRGPRGTAIITFAAGISLALVAACAGAEHPYGSPGAGAPALPPAEASPQPPSRQRLPGAPPAGRPAHQSSKEAMRRLIHTVAARQGVSPLFAEALARVESGLDPLAVSPNGCCRGLYQLHHLTAADLAVQDVYDPAQNATAGIEYFRRLSMRFRSIPLALVGFNAGPRIAAELEAGHRTTVPIETRRFVNRVLSIYRQLRAAQSANHLLHTQG